MREPDYTPMTFRETVNTLGAMIPSGVSSTYWPTEGHRPVVEFQAERLLEAGYRIVHDPDDAERILAGRKT